MSWPGGCTAPPTSPAVSGLLSIIFSWGGGFSLIQIILHTGSLSNYRETSAPSSHSRCSLLSSPQRAQPSAKFLSVRNKAELRVLRVAHLDNRLRTIFISFCTVLARVFCAARFLATAFLSVTFGSRFGELPSYWGPMVSLHDPIRPKGSDNYDGYKLLDIIIYRMNAPN